MKSKYLGVIAGVVVTLGPLFVSAGAYDAYQLNLINGEIESEPGAQSKFHLMYKAKLFPDAISNLGSGNVYYTLNKGKRVGIFDIEAKKYLGSWTLEPYTEEYLEPEWTDHGIDPVYEFAGLPGVGCTAKRPLRYSDLDQDGKAELILFLGGNRGIDEILVFSTVLKKVIFSSAVSIDYAWELTPQEAEDGGLEGYGEPEHAQYLFETDDPTHLGLRAYAKLYFGDYNGDDRFDIVVWRKLFESRQISDPVKGFTKKRDTFVHYTLQDGVYRKQPAPSATVKGWLVAQQKTWKQGYPSKSECPGQTDQYIPELHDTVLNDPEVLE